MGAADGDKIGMEAGEKAGAEAGEAAGADEAERLGAEVRTSFEGIKSQFDLIRIIYQEMI